MDGFDEKEGGNVAKAKNEELTKTKVLNAKEEKFCWLYLVYLNAGKAAREAGYNINSQYDTGSRLLRKVYIQDRISQIRKESAGKYDVTKESLIQELATIAKFDLREVYHEDGTLKKPSEWSEEAGRALAGVEVDEIIDGEGVFTGYTKKVKRDNKIGAISQLSRMLGYDQEEKKEDVNRSFEITLNLNK